MLDREVLDGRDVLEAGVIYQDIDRAEALGHLRHEPFAGGRIRHIAGDRDRAGELGRDGGTALPIEVRQRNPGTAVGEFDGDRATDPGCASGHQGDSVVEPVAPLVHRASGNRYCGSNPSNSRHLVTSNGTSRPTSGRRSAVDGW